MKRKRVILTVITSAVLFSGLSVYGYWVDKVDAKCNLSIMVPVHVQPRVGEDLTVEPEENGEAISLAPKNGLEEGLIEEKIIEEKSTDREMILDLEEPEVAIIPYDLENLMDEKGSKNTSGNDSNENSDHEPVVEEE